VSPNPATGPARLEFTLPRSGAVRISVYDVRGRLEGTQGRVAAGIYFVRLETEGRAMTQHLVRLR
jgi:hypothetical protein